MKNFSVSQKKSLQKAAMEFLHAFDFKTTDGRKLSKEEYEKERTRLACLVLSKLHPK